MVVAFGLENLSAVMRGLLPVLASGMVFLAHVVSGSLSITKFVVFVIIKTPILTQIS